MEDKNKPLIPTLKETSSKPQLKIKGLASGGLSLIERLKQFKKKDLAFIAAGLGVLFMAPLAEHFLMSPEDGGGAFKEGWNQRDGGAFGKGGSPYEGGINGLAPGSMAGGGSDVITPLNVRDPSALVMGPGATQAPPATAASPTPPPKSDSGDWKDALANAAAKGASAATKKASLPVPKTPLGGSGLRGLGAAAGGGGGSFSLPGLSAGNVPNKGGGGDSTGFARSASGYRGVAGARGSQNASAGSMEALKAAAGKAGTDFNRGGNAQSAVESAASRGMGGGDGGGPGAGGGRDDKASAQSQSKDSKSPGESLDFLRMKQEQEKAIDLKWKLREKAAMRWPNLQDKILEEVIMTPIKELTKGAMKAFGKMGTGADDTYNCQYIGSKEGEGMFTISDGDLKSCVGKDDKAASEEGAKQQYGYFPPDKSLIFQMSGCNDRTKPLAKCQAPADKGKKEDPPGAVTDTPRPAPGGINLTVDGVCKAIDDQKKLIDSAISSHGTASAKNEKGETIPLLALQKSQAALASMKQAGSDLVYGRDAVSGPKTGHCGAGSPAGLRSTIKDELDYSKTQLTEAIAAIESAMGQAAGPFGGAGSVQAKIVEQAKLILADFDKVKDSTDDPIKLEKLRAAIVAIQALSTAYAASITGADTTLKPVEAGGPLDKARASLDASAGYLKDVLTKLSASQTALTGPAKTEIDAISGYDEKKALLSQYRVQLEAYLGEQYKSGSGNYDKAEQWRAAQAAAYKDLAGSDVAAAALAANKGLVETSRQAITYANDALTKPKATAIPASDKTDYTVPGLAKAVADWGVPASIPAADKKTYIGEDGNSGTLFTAGTGYRPLLADWTAVSQPADNTKTPPVAERKESGKGLIVHDSAGKAALDASGKAGALKPKINSPF